MSNKKAPGHTGTKTEQDYATPSIPQLEAFERAYMTHLGMHLFPIKEHDKAPMTLNGFKDATNDFPKYQQLHGGKPHNIGMPTGPVNDVFVLDVDPRHGGEKTLERLVEQYGPMPETWQTITQSDGSHYFFQWDQHRPVGNKTDVLPGIDIRGDGGYVVLPPSRVEGEYRWARSPSKFPLLEAPKWLYDLLETKQQQGSQDLSYLAEGAASGNRNVTITQLAGMLLGRGLPVKLAWALVESYNAYHCSPPLDSQELLKTFKSIAEREIRKRQRRQRRLGA